MEFAENFKRICTEQGTTPTAVLKEMGVATSKVTMWNNGSLPKQDMLVRLAQFLNCSVMDFFADEDEIERQRQYQEDYLNEDEKEIVRIFRSLDRRSKHEFMNTAYDFEKRTIREGDSSAI